MPLVVPDDDAPVLPDVPELLEVPDVPVDDGELEVEPEDEPMPEDEFEDDEPLALGVLELPLEEGELVDGEIEPVAEPPADPMPDAEPEAEPDADGPVELQAVKANAQAIGMIHVFI